MKLSKAQREQVRLKFGGRCAYCGCELGRTWHADHLEPVQRVTRWDSRLATFVRTGEVDYPERDTMENMMPACQACNIDKINFSLESWRQRLQGLPGVLQRNHSAWRHALRFGLVQETGARVIFYFERIALEPSHAAQ